MFLSFLSERIFLTEIPPSPTSTPPLPSHTKKAGIRRSLKEKFYYSAAQRSPLSTRNLIEDSPDPAYKPTNQHRGRGSKMGVAYQKAGLRKRLIDNGEEQESGDRIVGRYYPVMDKENY